MKQLNLKLLDSGKLGAAQLIFSAACIGYIVYKATRPKTQIQKDFERMIFGSPELIIDKALFI